MERKPEKEERHLSKEKERYHKEFDLAAIRKTHNSREIL